jgi:fumarate reductase subunit C
LVQVDPDAVGHAMSQTPRYTEYHPRWYRHRVSTWWWLKRGSYLVFILREMSSLFVAWFVVFTLFQIHAVSRGGEEYQEFQAWTRNPFIVLLNVVSLFFVVFHTVTWFALTPKALVVRMGGKRVPGWWLVAGNYVAWVVISALVAWLILKG